MCSSHTLVLVAWALVQATQGSRLHSPSQLHLSLVNGSDVMALCWTIKHIQQNEKMDLESKVEYWPEFSPWHRHSVDGIGSSYYKSVHFKARLTGLQESTKYCYVIDSAPQAAGCFKTQSKSRNRKTKFLSYADVGVNRSMPTLKSMGKEKDIDFIVHGGDIGYGDDIGFDKKKSPGSSLKPGKSGYEYVYDQFMDLIEPLSRRVPYMVGVGNHDVSSSILNDGFFDNFTAYRTRWKMPSDESDGVENMWYSYNVGPVHISVIDTESDYDGAPTNPHTIIAGGRGGGFRRSQIDWLKQDLQTASTDGKLSFIVTGSDANIDGSTHKMDRGNSYLKKWLEPLLHEYKVDIYIGGHIHFYERSYPVKNGKICDEKQKCVVFITNGAGGSNEGPNDHGANTNLVAAGVYNKDGYAVVTADQDTLNWQFIVTSQGTPYVGDLFELRKENHLQEKK